MNLIFRPIAKKYSKLLFLLVLCVFIVSCKTGSDHSLQIESINEIYDEAEKQTVFNSDSAALLLDKGINWSIQIQDDSLTVAGLFRKANVREKQGLSQEADSLYSLLISGNKYNVDSASVNKIKLHYVHFLQLNGKQKKAYDLCTEALLFFKQKNNEKTVVLGNIYLSDLYTQDNEFTKAMGALTEALKIAERIDDKKSLALIFGSIGKLYFRQQDYKKCLDSFNKVLAYNTQLNDIENMAVANQNIGTILLIQEQYEKAEKYLLAADSVLSNAGLGAKQVHVLNSLGALYERQQKYDEAIKTYNEVLELNKKLNNPYVQSNVYTNIGNVYYDRKNWNKTEYYYAKYYNSLIESGETDFRVYYENMMFLNDERKNWKEAYFWARKFHSHSDSIFNIQKYKETENLHSLYETEKKDLQLEKMKAVNEKDKATILKDRIRFTSIILLLLLTITFGLVYNKQNRLKLQSYKELVKKNEELTALNNQKRQQLLLDDRSKNLSQNKNGSDKTTIAEELVRGIKLKLNEQINNKFYTKPELTLSETASLLGTNTSYLSQIINDSFACNFSTFINQLRVEEAQRLLKDSKFNNLSIEGIGKQAGFKSKSVFNSAFKKITGVTPSAYKESSV